MAQKFDADENPNLFWGIIGATAAFLLLSCIFCARYWSYQLSVRDEIRYRNKVLAPVQRDTANWVDPSDYNGHEEEVNMRDISVPMPVNNTTMGTPVSRTIVLNASKDDYKNDLILYYSKYAPEMTLEDVQIIVDNTADVSELRDALDEQLKEEHGEGLKEYIDAINAGFESRPTKMLMSERDATPHVQFVQDKPVGATSDGVELTLRTDLLTALDRRGLSNYYDRFNRNGIINVTDMRTLDENFVSENFPVHIHQPILDMIEMAKLLHIAENQNPDI